MSADPASSNKTLLAGSAERRLAKTQPADPAPTIMYSCEDENVDELSDGDWWLFRCKIPVDKKMY